MKQLKLNGSVKFLGIDLPVIEGGFGDDKRCVTDKHVSSIHGQPNREIRRRINDNIKRFKDGVDYIDLKGVGESHTLLNDMGYAKQAITQAKNIYLLSERGYSKLIKIMDDDKSWEVHDELIDNYFSLREQVKLALTASEQAILNIVQAKGEIATAMAIKEYENVVTEPLRLEVDRYQRFIGDDLTELSKKELASKLDTSPQTLAARFKKVGIYTPKSQVKVDFVKMFPDITMTKMVETEYTVANVGNRTKKDWIWTGEGAKVVVDYLVGLGQVSFTENKGFKLVNAK